MGPQIVSISCSLVTVQGSHYPFAPISLEITICLETSHRTYTGRCPPKTYRTLKPILHLSWLAGSLVIFMKIFIVLPMLLISSNRNPHNFQIGKSEPRFRKLEHKSLKSPQIQGTICVWEKYIMTSFQCRVIISVRPDPGCLYPTGCERLGKRTCQRFRALCYMIMIRKTILNLKLSRWINKFFSLIRTN